MQESGALWAKKPTKKTVRIWAEIQQIPTSYAPEFASVYGEFLVFFQGLQQTVMLCSLQEHSQSAESENLSQACK